MEESLAAVMANHAAYDEATRNRVREWLPKESPRMHELAFSIHDSHSYDAYLVVRAWHELDKQLDFRLGSLALHQTYEKITASGIYNGTTVRIEPDGQIASYQIGMMLFATPGDCAAYLKESE